MEKEFKIECGTCGKVTEELTIKQASEEPCPSCGSNNVSVYGQETELD